MTSSGAAGCSCSASSSSRSPRRRSASRRATPGSSPLARIQGIGAAFMMPATLSIISNAFPPARARQGDRHLGRRLGASRSRSGPVVGGWLTEEVSWRAIFFINLPVAVGAVAVTLFAAHESRDETVDRARRLPRHRDDDHRPDRARASRSSRATRWGWGSPGDHRAARPQRRLRSWPSSSIERRVRAPMVDFEAASARKHVPGREPRRLHRSRSRCSRRSSSSRSTCRTSSATRRSRQASASSPRRS